MRTSDWDSAEIRAIGRRYVAEAYDLASELDNYGADASELLRSRPDSTRPREITLPMPMVDVLMALLLSLPRRQEKPGALGDNVLLLKPGRSIEARLKQR